MARIGLGHRDYRQPNVGWALSGGLHPPGYPLLCTLGALPPYHAAKAAFIALPLVLFALVMRTCVMCARG